MDDAQRRRGWLFPPSEGVFDGIELAYLDPYDEADRHLLIAAEHPEMARAIQEERDEIELHGVTMSPSLHLSMHEIVANRIWDNDPPEWWDTAQRLTRAGYDRHEVLHMLAGVVSDEVYAAMNGEQRSDTASSEALAALPDSWEAMRAPAPIATNRAERRALQRRKGHRPHR